MVGAAAALLATGAFALLTGSSGCGASYHALYEGEVRFEHCYRLDEEPSVPARQKHECWLEWTRFYTFGQTRDRLEYAQTRQRELRQLLDKRDAGPADASTTPAAVLVAPAPTSPFEPPPKVHAVREATDAGAEPAPTEKQPPATAPSAPSSPASPIMAPGKACLDGCSQTRGDCKKNCLNQPGCLTQCDHRYRFCGRGCL